MHLISLKSSGTAPPTSVKSLPFIFHHLSFPLILSRGFCLCSQRRLGFACWLRAGPLSFSLAAPEPSMMRRWMTLFSSASLPSPWPAYYGNWEQGPAWARSVVLEGCAPGSWLLARSRSPSALPVSFLFCVHTPRLRKWFLRQDHKILRAGAQAGGAGEGRLVLSLACSHSSFWGPPWHTKDGASLSPAASPSGPHWALLAGIRRDVC